MNEEKPSDGIHPDIVVVDLDVREMAVWSVISRIGELSDTPIVVTGREATREDMSRAFQLGVGGFLARPYSYTELLIRLDALQARAPKSDGGRWIYQRNGLTVDIRSCEVFVHGRPVVFTGTEYRLLTYLIERRGWVLSHDQIPSHVWGNGLLRLEGPGEALRLASAPKNRDRPQGADNDRCQARPRLHICRLTIPP